MIKAISITARKIFFFMPHRLRFFGLGKSKSTPRSRAAARSVRPTLSHQQSAVDVQHMAGDVRRFLRRQKADCAGNVGGSAYAAERDRLHRTLLEFFAQSGGHAGLDKSR